MKLPYQLLAGPKSQHLLTERQKLKKYTESKQVTIKVKSYRAHFYRGHSTNNIKKNTFHH